LTRAPVTIMFPPAEAGRSPSRGILLSISLREMPAMKVPHV
jgi:hypothetical protein